jgi:protein-histidine pros-kinase
MNDETRSDFYRVLAEETPDAVIARTPDGKVLYWNPGAERIFGHSSAEAVGCLLLELIIPPERLVQERENLREVLEGSTAKYESYRRKKDGSLICLSISSWAKRDAEGNVRYFIMEMKDVTGTRVERDCRQIEARYGSLLQSTPDAMLIVNCTGHIVLANGLAEKMFGYGRFELRGRLIEEMMPLRYRSCHVGHRSDYSAQPRARMMGACLDLFGLRQDGTEFPVEISLAPLETEDDTFTISAIRDVSDRKKEDDRFKSLLEATPDSMVIVNCDGNIVLVNSQTEKLFGHRREDLLGKSAEVLIPKRFRAKHPDFRKEFFSEPKPRTMGESPELYCLRKDGTEFPAELSFSPLETEGGTLVISTIRDKSERNRLESVVAARTRELQFANKELKAFCYSVSHDLTGPLRALDGFSKMLKEEHTANLSEEGLKCLSRIEDAARRMTLLINDLLRLSQVDLHEIYHCKVDLTEVAKQILDELRQTSRDRDVEWEIAPGLLASGDPNLLRIVLDNLLRNAWKFTQKHPKPHIEVGMTEQVDGPVYFVRDNGAGFNMQYAHKLFAPFQRLHTTREFEGNGIGLAIAQRIIVRHGGTIWADGKVDGGATFSFTLPAPTLSAQPPV